MLQSQRPLPKAGAIYLRPGFHTAAATPLAFADSAASPLVRHLVADLLSRNLRVRLDHVAPCDTIAARYDRYNAALSAVQNPLERSLRTVHPVQLFHHAPAHCFSYTVTYEVPLRTPVQWKGQRLSAMPLRLTLVHPTEDFDRFFHE